MKTFRIADNIVFENDNFIAINKPAGISSLHERLGEAISIIELVKKIFSYLKTNKNKHKMEDRLFQLIHALSKSEKRYFNKFASMNRTESNLLRLFEAICKQKSYDEAAIKKKFTGEKFVVQLFVTKKHLYDAILKSMRLYNSERSVRYRLQAMLQDIQYLYEKQLFEACNELIAKAQQIAEQHEMFYIGLQLLYWHDKQMVRGYYKKYHETEIENVTAQFNLLLEKLKRERAYRTLETKMGFSYFYLQEAARLDFQAVILKNPILHDENYALSNKAKLFYYSVHTQYYYARLDWEKVYFYQKKMQRNLG